MVVDVNTYSMRENKSRKSQNKKSNQTNKQMNKAIKTKQ